MPVRLDATCDRSKPGTLVRNDACEPGAGVKSMPLVAYFGAIGALLTAILLLTNVLLESGHNSSRSVFAPVETNLPKPRISASTAQHTVGVTRIAPSEDIQDGRVYSAAPAAADRAEPQQRPSESDVERRSLKKAKPDSKVTKTRSRSRHADAGWRRKRPTYSNVTPRSYGSGFYSYARETPASSFPTRDSLGPH
jgi:hypothetical protein